MATTREQFFECSFQSEEHRRAVHVRAWTAADAKRMFLDLLAEDGIQEPGKVSVTPVRPMAPLVLGIQALPHASHS